MSPSNTNMETRDELHYLSMGVFLGIRDHKLLWVRNIVASCWIIFCDCTDVFLRWGDGMRWRQALWWKAEIYRRDEGINIHLCIWLSFTFRSHKNDRWSIYLYFLPKQKVTLGEVFFWVCRTFLELNLCTTPDWRGAVFQFLYIRGLNDGHSRSLKGWTQVWFIFPHNTFFFHFYITWETHEEERKRNMMHLKKILGFLKEKPNMGSKIQK